MVGMAHLGRGSIVMSAAGIGIDVARAKRPES
jgi:hypothetical protein